MERKTYHMVEIGFTVVAKPHSHRVEYEVYELLGEDQNGDFLYQERGAPCKPTPVSSLSDAEIFLHGWVKWDGCSDWHFDAQDELMIHACQRADLVNIGQVMVACWDLTDNLCEAWSP